MAFRLLAPRGVRGDVGVEVEDGHRVSLAGRQIGLVESILRNSKL